MAVVTTKSAVITNRDSSPKVISNANLAKGALQEFVGVCAVASGDSVGSKYLFGAIPSNARMSELKVYCPDIGTTTAMDVGLYRTTDDGGAVVDADFFSAAVVLNAGAVNGTEITHGNVISVANAEKMLWQALGLAADPKVNYDVVGTLTGAADAAGSVALKGRYAI